MEWVNGTGQVLNTPVRSYLLKDQASPKTDHLNFLTNMSNFMSTVKATVTTSQQLPSWVDEFLDASSPRRGSHRSSASDPITFFDTQFLQECQSSEHGAATAGTTAHGFDMLDEDQLICMFSDDIALPPPSPSNRNSNNNEKPVALDAIIPTEPPSATPRRVKRILANRQSAQRSRVRKLQYISELERSVTSLQTEVSTLSPRVAFLDHQRLILNVDNSTMKQRIAVLAQDKIFKDAHQEALKKEIERLWQIYHHQNLHKMGNSVNHSGHSPGSPPPSQPQPPANNISALGM